ncbi:MAG: orotidine-5'-phosphate decarboxylase [Planctomycetales bacterium]
MSFSIRLHDAIRAKRTPALVGIDPRFDWLPAPVVAAAEKRGAADGAALVAAAFEEFSSRLIDVVAPLVPAVKPQAAFFEEHGPAGCAALARVIRRARGAGLIVICDAKRGDIGSTAEAYARGYLAGADPAAAPWGADALTVSPYLGADTLEPFVKTAVERGAGIYVLVRTSNPGAGTFQDLLAAGRIADPSRVASEQQPVYRHVARVVEELAARTADESGFGCVGAVVGATYPQELAELREAMPHAPLLIPGYGSQGGDASDVAAGFTAEGLGALVNSSRGIDFAHRGEPFASRFGPDRWEEAVEAATRAMIADLATHTPAGTLRG